MSKDVEIDFCPLCSSGKRQYLYHDFQNNRYVKCEECGLVYQNPRRVTEYEENYWGKSIDPDGKERLLQEEKESKIKNLYKEDLEFIENFDGGKILDAGCGYGFFLSALSDKWEKYGVEYSQFTVDFVKKEFPDIIIEQGDLECDIFENEKFDVIYCYHVIEHVSDPKKVITKLRGLLKKDGILVISTPNVESFCARRFRGNYRLLGSPHIIMFSPKTLQKLLETCELKVFKKSYPFFKTDYFTFKNLCRLFDTKKVSPPFYGNIMTFYTKK